MNAPQYEFLRQAGRILNSGQARTLLLTGAIHDLFFLEPKAQGADGAGEYVPLLQHLTAHWALPGRMIVVYELNGPIHFLREEDRDKVKDAWLRFRTGLNANQVAIQQMLRPDRAQAELDAIAQSFDTSLQLAIGKPTVALELLRQMCLISRSNINGPLLRENLIVLVEAADMLIPAGEITRLADADRHRIAICRDWFSDPGFMDGDDAVIMLAESRSFLNERIAQLPQVLEVSVESADASIRRHFIEWFDERQQAGQKLRYEGSKDELAELTGGLSVHALNQLLRGACHAGTPLANADIVVKVEQYIRSLLGEDMIEFKKPSHTLDNVVGFTQLKRFLREEAIPRMKASGPEAIAGAAVAGPIGGGKTFIFEAVAAELNMVVLVLKNIRSQWFGQTDVQFERLRRVLASLAKVMIFVDEADTQFGRVDSNAHATERRLTGKIQAMMSDQSLRGRVVWLLMTARIHLLSPDIRRPGRAGDLIIPVLDPEGEDRDAFVTWAITPVHDGPMNDGTLQELRALVEGYSAAQFAAMRSELIARARGNKLNTEQIRDVVNDLIPPDIGKARRYQTLQALANCTRRSLLPDPKVDDATRQSWHQEIQSLEQQGIR